MKEFEVIYAMADADSHSFINRRGNLRPSAAGHALCAVRILNSQRQKNDTAELLQMKVLHTHWRF